MPNTSKRIFIFPMSQTNIKILFLFSDNKCKDGANFGSQRKKVRVAIYHSKYSLNQLKVKNRQKIYRNFQELRFIYSHFQLNRQFPKTRERKGKEGKNLALEAVFRRRSISVL